MLPFLQQDFGNPSSTHEYGRRAHDAVEQARAEVAAVMGAQRDEIVFTGGGTEASNHAIKGAVFAKMQGFLARFFSAPHLIASAIEHPATLQPCAFLKKLGCKITLLGVDRYGSVDPYAVEKAISGATL